MKCIIVDNPANPFVNNLNTGNLFHYRGGDVYRKTSEIKIIDGEEFNFCINLSTNEGVYVPGLTSCIPVFVAATSVEGGFVYQEISVGS